MFDDQTEAHAVENNCSSATGRASCWLRACLMAPILPDFHVSHVLTVSYHVAECVPS